MIGFPTDLKTKQDYYNATEYAVHSGRGKEYLIARLQAILNSTTYNGLKAEAYAMRPEKQHQDNYEKKYDVNCILSRIGFSLEEVEALIAKLEVDNNV